MIFLFRIIPRLVFSLAVWLSVLSIDAAENGRVFRAGAATSNITGNLGQIIVGGIVPLVSTHVHDELQARPVIWRLTLRPKSPRCCSNCPGDCRDSCEPR